MTTTNKDPWPVVAAATFKRAQDSVSAAITEIDGDELPLPRGRRREADSIVRALERLRIRIQAQIDWAED